MEVAALVSEGFEEVLSVRKEGRQPGHPSLHPSSLVFIHHVSTFVPLCDKSILNLATTTTIVSHIYLTQSVVDINVGIYFFFYLISYHIRYLLSRS